MVWPELVCFPNLWRLIQNIVSGSNFVTYYRLMLIGRKKQLNFFTRFCLRPLAKDQGITWVFVVVLVVVLVVHHHLVHFLFKRNLSEKNIPDWESNRGPSEPQPGTYPLSHRFYWCENWFLYLAADHGPVLVDTCCFADGVDRTRAAWA